MIRTIGQLITALGQYNDDYEVYFEFAHMRPTEILSWRGDYSMAALGHTPAPTPSCTVKSLRAELMKAISGKVQYHGWKGGEYTFTRDTELWVDNYGDGSHTRISKVKCDGSTVSLRCKWAAY